jgi:hypothetical protein
MICYIVTYSVGNNDLWFHGSIIRIYNRSPFSVMTRWRTSKAFVVLSSAFEGHIPSINKDRSFLSLGSRSLDPKVDVEVQQHFRSKLSSSHFWISILLIVYAYPHASISVIFIYYLSIYLISSHLIYLSIYFSISTVITYTVINPPLLIQIARDLPWPGRFLASSLRSRAKNGGSNDHHNHLRT